jgi:carbamoyl-phosphate synthase large subunit
MMSAACQIADKWFELPRTTSADYAKALEELCIKYQIGVVIPTTDTELIRLAKLKSNFSKMGIHILVCDEKLITSCNDKRLTANFFQFKGLDTPALFDKKDINYPCLVKPYDGSLSSGISLLRSDADLTDKILNNKKNIFCVYIDHDTHSEFTCDLYYRSDGTLTCVVPRQRMEVRGGEVAKAKTQMNNIVDVVFSKLSEIKGACGCLTLQAFRQNDTGKLWFIEINARFGGGYPLTRSAGADFQLWIMEEYLLGEIPNTFLEWTSGLKMLRYDEEILVQE